KNLIILTFDGHDVNYLAALDKSTGKTVWKTDRNIEYKIEDGDYHKAYSTPCVVMVNGQSQLVSPSAECTIAYDPDTGKEIWRIHHGGMNEACRPVFGHGLIFLTSGHLKDLLAVRVGGTGTLEKADIAWQTKRDVPSRPSLLLKDDLLFMVSDQGIASCLEAKTGKLQWTERLGAPCSASPIYAEGRIYAADENKENGRTYVF